MSGENKEYFSNKKKGENIMDKKTGNKQLLGLLSGWYSFGRKREKPPSKGGCLSGIIYIIVLIFCFSQGLVTVGIVLALPLIISLIIGLIKGFVLVKFQQRQEEGNQEIDEKE